MKITLTLQTTVVVFAFTFCICHSFVEDGRYWGSVHSIPSSVPLLEDFFFFVCGIWAGSEGFFCSSYWNWNLLLWRTPQTFNCSSDILFYLPDWCWVLTLCFSLETVSLLWGGGPLLLFAGALLAWLWGGGREEVGFQLYSDSISDLGKSWGPGPWMCGLHQTSCPPEVVTLFPTPLPQLQSPQATFQSLLFHR